MANERHTIFRSVIKGGVFSSFEGRLPRRMRSHAYVSHHDMVVPRVRWFPTGTPTRSVHLKRAFDHRATGAGKWRPGCRQAGKRSSHNDAASVATDVWLSTRVGGTLGLQPCLRFRRLDTLPRFHLYKSPRIVAKSINFILPPPNPTRIPLSMDSFWSIP